MEAFRVACHLNLNYLYYYVTTMCILLQLTDMFLPVAVGGTVHFAQPDALKVGSLCNTL